MGQGSTAVAELADLRRSRRLMPSWPARSGNSIENAGAPRWSLPEVGGESCPRPLLVQRYAQLASGSLTAVFILSQHDAAVRRLAWPPRATHGGHWLSEIGAGRASRPSASRT